MTWRPSCKRWLAMRRGVALVVVLHVGSLHAERAAVFKPPSGVAQAQTRFRHGEQLFDAKHYDEAAVEFAAAYELDPRSKFLLFNLAIARRLAGSCHEAIEAYRQFLDAKPPAALAKKATAGIEKCEQTVATTEPAAATPTATPPAEAPPNPVVSAPPGATQPPTKPVVEPRRIEVIHVPWYRDVLGDALAGAGASLAIFSGVLYLRARSEANDTFSPSSVKVYLDDRHAAVADQDTATVMAGLGTALLIAGGIRYLMRSSERTVTLAVDAHGAGAMLEGSF